MSELDIKHLFEMLLIALEDQVKLNKRQFGYSGHKENRSIDGIIKKSRDYLNTIKEGE